MKLSTALLFLLTASSFNNLESATAAAPSSSEVNDHDANVVALRGANRNIDTIMEDETTNTIASAATTTSTVSDHTVLNDVVVVVVAGTGDDAESSGHSLLLATGVVAMVEEEEVDDTYHHRKLGNKWEGACQGSEGKLHEEKCGNGLGNCCTGFRVGDDGKYNQLVCRKKRSTSEFERCHEIRSNDIRWSILCSSSGGKTKDQECDSSASAGEEGACCTETIEFPGFEDEDDYSSYYTRKSQLKCKKKDGEENSSYRCRESHTASD